MSKSSMEFWVGISWMMALITVISGVALCINYGTIDVPGRYYSDAITNWPLIAGSLAGAIYSVLFASAMSIIRVSAVNSRTTLELLLAERGAEEPPNQPVEPEKGEGDTWS